MMRVLHDNVLVEIQKPTQTRGGIILSQKAIDSAPTMIGIVKEIGGGKEVAECGLKLNNIVLLYAGIMGKCPAVPNKPNMILVPHEAVLGVMGDGDA